MDDLFASAEEPARPDAAARFRELLQLATPWA